MALTLDPHHWPLAPQGSSSAPSPPMQPPSSKHAPEGTACHARGRSHVPGHPTMSRGPASDGSRNHSPSPWRGSKQKTLERQGRTSPGCCAPSWRACENAQTAGELAQGRHLGVMYIWGEHLPYGPRVTVQYPLKTFTHACLHPAGVWPLQSVTWLPLFVQLRWACQKGPDVRHQQTQLHNTG